MYRLSLPLCPLPSVFEMLLFVCLMSDCRSVAVPGSPIRRVSAGVAIHPCCYLLSGYTSWFGTAVASYIVTGDLWLPSTMTAGGQRLSLSLCLRFFYDMRCCLGCVPLLGVTSRRLLILQRARSVMHRPSSVLLFGWLVLSLGFMSDAWGLCCGVLGYTSRLCVGSWRLRVPVTDLFASLLWLPSTSISSCSGAAVC